MAGDAASGAGIKVVAVGDIMLGGESALEREPLGFDHPFVRVGPLLRSADVTIGNLEGPLTSRGSRVWLKRYAFRSPPESAAPALARAGFDVVSLANNHILDYGVAGLDDTMAALRDAGIRFGGAGRTLDDARQPVYLDVRGSRIAFLAYSFIHSDFAASSTRAGTAFGDEQRLCADVRAARARSDAVLVSLHWGKQWSDTARPDQRLLAHAIIDAGAVAVIGHHPHVLQGIERYRDGVIVYSLGNFTFGLRNRRVTRSAIAELLLRVGRVTAFALRPIDVDNNAVRFQPLPLAGPAADGTVELLRRLSASLNTPLQNRGGRAVLALDDALR